MCRTPPQRDQLCTYGTVRVVSGVVSVEEHLGTWGASGACTVGMDPTEDCCIYTGGPETVPQSCLEGISNWKERFRSNFPYAQRSLALTSLRFQCALSCDPSNVVERQGPCRTAPLSIPPRTLLECVFSVVAQLASSWILVEAGTYVGEQGVREERTRETSEAKKGDLRLWA